MELKLDKLSSPLNKSNLKRIIYMRTFSGLLAVYLVLMIFFSVFLIIQVNKMKKMELGSFVLQINSDIGDILQNNTDSKTKTVDILKIKKELVNYPSFFNYSETELALFTDDYDLIFNTNDHWLCSYTERTEGNKGYSGYGYINQEKWFSKEDAVAIYNYLYADLKAKKQGDLTGYSIGINGFWVKNEEIIPKEITVTPMYASKFDEKGLVSSSSSGISTNWKIYKARYGKTENLQYFEYGHIIPKYTDKDSANRTELRKQVVDSQKLKNYVEQSIVRPYVQHVKFLTYRYYLAQPYKNIIKLTEDNKKYSEFWVTFAREVNLLASCSATLAFVWVSCLLTFMGAALILSAQTYKTYRHREELEMQRNYTTNALAHDLKTPLSIISGYAQNLIENIHSNKRERYAENIVVNINRMDVIIREMLELSRLEYQQFMPEYQDVALGKVCSDIINCYAEVSNEKNLSVSLEGDALVKADNSLIVRVIDNLFINALDNTPGGGKIKIKIFDDTLEIYNSGSHIPDEKLKEIWQPYKKADESRSNTKGTGLGLSIVSSILEMHKFSYGAENCDAGVIFWFKFGNRSSIINT